MAVTCKYSKGGYMEKGKMKWKYSSKKIVLRKWERRKA
jgi:hypothetical protein